MVTDLRKQHGYLIKRCFNENCFRIWLARYVMQKANHFGIRFGAVHLCIIRIESEPEDQN